MMHEFRPYMHIERYGNDEVIGIELGELYVFPKLDGTNSSTWAIPTAAGGWGVGCGSRTRTLSADSDNAGFFAACQDLNGNGFARRLLDFHIGNPHLRLYGEWLVPHTLTTYRDDTWNRFWVFDVFNDETDTYYDYNTYQPLLDQCGLDYMPPLAKIKGGDYEYFLHVLKNNVFGIEDGKGIGEGIVLKNYNFTNKFGNVVWAKIINNEFKEQHHREMGCPETERKIVEEDICQRYVTDSLCTKVYAKIVNDESGWTSRYIPRLLETVYHDLVKEELWSAIRDSKPAPTINFGTLRHFCNGQVKKVLPHLF